MKQKIPINNKILKDFDNEIIAAIVTMINPT